MAEPFIGEIRMVGFQFAPERWCNADGQLMQISQNPTLFSLFGTLYGGNGTTTFGIPDFRGRVPIHTGHGTGLPTYQMGQAGGFPEVALGSAELPTHSHGTVVHAAAATGDQVTPQDHYWAEPQRAAYLATKNATMADDAVEVVPAGGGNAHYNMQPYLTVRFCVALDGIYPQRP